MARFFITVWHGESGSHGAVVDRKTGRLKGQASTFRDGGFWVDLLRIQRDALNRAWERGEESAPVRMLPQRAIPGGVEAE
jgi:hypothetical protein